MCMNIFKLGRVNLACAHVSAGMMLTLAEPKISECLIIVACFNFEGSTSSRTLFVFI